MMESRLEKWQRLSGFWLKIIAFISMTADHVGIFLWQQSTSATDAFYISGYILRCFGRLAFPLFVLFLVEGLIHSKNIGRYFLRLAVLLGLVMVAQIFLYYFNDPDIGLNPFIDLLVNGLFIFLLTRKSWKRFLAIIPLAFVIMVTVVQYLELGPLNLDILWLPPYLRMGYSLFGLLLTIAFYFSYKLAKQVLIDKSIEISERDLAAIPQYRGLVNILMAIFLFVLNIIIWLLSYAAAGLDLYLANIQTWSIFAGLIIIVYNGKRGYDAKWFRIASYAYFPAHIALIYLLFALIFGV